eukprot:gnl/Spiro4/21353_TR10431_c0_g1_i1.p2 gnl/Spiro4/21353_TR10431_c0_g1~~gnl/Spiro4/21353_TR10431_c0_g1_i1.p2  ORF type:complete len:215 (+),score=50.34 gnl/Spiro4/21353_TR10431_c0_g1_i1:48-647(+)
MGEVKIREIKVVLLGDAGVGKSSLVLRFVTNSFRQYAESTIGASFMSKTLVVDDTAIKYQIWDTAGQEKYHSLAPMYYRGAAAAIVVYDTTKRESFNTLKTWVKELKQNGPPNIVLAIAGNKCDLADQKEVDTDVARAYASEIGAIFLETSAKVDTGVGDLFVSISRVLPKEDAHPDKLTGVHSLSPGENKRSSSKKCC